MGWFADAACRGADHDLFFPEGATGPARAQSDQAKAICSRCPVTSRCLQFALDTGQHYGIWGGLDEHERRALRRTRLNTARQ